MKYLVKSNPLTKQLIKLNKISHNDIKNFKSNCEKWWEIFEYKEKNEF